MSGKKAGPRAILLALLKAALYALYPMAVQLLVALIWALASYFGAADQSANALPQLKDILFGNILLVTAVADLAALGLLAIFFALRKKKLAEAFSLRPIPKGNAARIALIALVSSLGIGCFLALLPEGLMAGYEQATEVIDLGQPLYLIFGVVLVAPLVEEFIFRGLVLTRLLSALPKVPAVLIASALFAAMHGNGVWIAYAFAIGAILCTVFLKTRSIWACVLLHVLFNFCGTFAGLSDLLPAWLCALLLIASAAAIVDLLRKVGSGPSNDPDASQA